VAPELALKQNKKDDFEGPSKGILKGKLQRQKGKVR